MKKKSLIYILSSLIGSSSLVIFLFMTSFDFAKQKNSFLRHLLPHSIIPRDTLDLKYDSYYVAGGFSNYIYLGNYMNPLHLVEFNTTTKDTTHIQIKLTDTDTLKYWSFRLKIDSPNFFLADGTIPAIFKGQVNNWEARRSKYDSAYFVEYVPIGCSSFAIRSLSSSTKEHVLGKEMETSPHIRFFPDLLQKQIDGVFCVDGMLTYDKSSSRVIYTYYYRNQFIVMDTNMNLAYRGNTIDTISKVKIKIAKINSDNARVISAPPMRVNGVTSVSDGYLFVNSKLMAKNETEDMFNEASVIDVYNLTDGSYKLSFHLYAFNKTKVKSFSIVENRLIAIYDHYLLTFDLRSKYFDSIESR